jgi:hypothetical protein
VVATREERERNKQEFPPLSASPFFSSFPPTASQESSATIPSLLPYLPPSLKGGRNPIIALILSLILLLYLIHSSLPRGYLAYSTRPLWDKDEAPSQVLLHYHSEDLGVKQACELHGWGIREHDVEVWDAVRTLLYTLRYPMY